MKLINIAPDEPVVENATVMLSRQHEAIVKLREALKNCQDKIYYLDGEHFYGRSAACDAADRAEKTLKDTEEIAK